MAYLPPVDSVNRAILLTTIQHIAEYDAIIKQYKEDDQAMAQTQADLRRQLDELESKRKVTSKALESAESSKKVMESAAEKLRCISPLINYLPDDTLIQIFHLLVLERIECHKHQFLELKPFPFDNTLLIIGQVCSHWRSIVHQTSKLWDHVPTMTLEITNKIKNITSITTWLSRGTRSAQSIFLNGKIHSKFSRKLVLALGSNPVPFKSIHVDAKVSAPTNVQWNINDICAKEVSVFRHNDEPLKFYMPLMQYATLLTISGTPPAWRLTQWPSLKSLTLRSRHISLRPPHFMRSDFQYLLEAAPNLVELEVDFHTVPDTTSDKTHHVVRHASLSSMTIQLSHLETNIGPFGVRLDAPLLKHLKITAFHHYSNSTSPKLPMSQWDQPVKLSLSNLDGCDVSNLLDFSDELPNLNTLQLEGGNSDALLIGITSFFSPTTSETATLPFQKLSHVVLKGTDVKGSTLIRFLEARSEFIKRGAKDVAAIGNVVLYDNDWITTEEWKRINVLLEIGVGSRVQ